MNLLTSFSPSFCIFRMALGVRVIKRVHMIFTPFGNVQHATGLSHISACCNSLLEYYVVTLISWEFAQHWETEKIWDEQKWIVLPLDDNENHNFHAMSLARFHCQVFSFPSSEQFLFPRPPYVWSFHVTQSEVNLHVASICWFLCWCLFVTEFREHGWCRGNGRHSLNWSALKRTFIFFHFFA